MDIAAEGGASISIGENGGTQRQWAKGCVEYHDKNGGSVAD